VRSAIAIFRLLRRWAQRRAGDNVTIEEFVALAERVSGEDLDAFFETWLFTPEKPPGIGGDVNR
jgi:aminopeptidase N